MLGRLQFMILEKDVRIQVDLYLSVYFCTDQCSSVPIVFYRYDFHMYRMLSYGLF